MGMIGIQTIIIIYQNSIEFPSYVCVEVYNLIGVLGTVD
jgi:hypothetical protein